MENLDRRMLLAGLGLVGAAAAASAGAGTLTPPAGPVLPTGKTTTEIEPRTAVNAANTPGNATSVYRITLPGSYYLTGNVTGLSGKNGVEITVGGVTLDLNGFELAGVAGSLIGVYVNGFNADNVCVQNGTVRNWGFNGVSLIDGFARNCRVSGISASTNGDNGILAGGGCTISHCVAMLNANQGIVTNEGCTITHCAAYFNSSTGIFGGNGSMISNCAASNNTTVGIQILTGGTITDCSTYANTVYGISAGSGSSVVNCTAFSNGVVGILGGGECAITQCSANSNFGDGISVNNGCSVQGCQASNNTFNGILALQGCTVRNCQVRSNVLNGISIGNNGLVVDNLCDVNGLAAGTQSNIYINGSSCRVDGNAVTGGDRGIATSGGGINNLIIRNSCRGGTNPYGGIGGTNDVGPIGSAATSTSPWANILF